tara:strand:- start:252 stop:1010 length:759 start_codon:yes stop_codon:yes gene_type:complete
VSDQYSGEERRKGPDPHFEITQQNVRDIGDMKSDIAGLKVGQDAMVAQTKAGFENTSDKFSHLSKQLADMAKPKPPLPLIGIGTLAIVIMSAFGTVMVYLSSQAATSMQREADLRIDHVTERYLIAQQKNDQRHYKQVEAEMRSDQESQDAFLSFVANVQQKFNDDDIREQKDAYDKGFAAAKFEDLFGRVKVIEDELSIDQRRGEDWKLSTTDRLSKNETGLRATGKYMQEHVNKRGKEGHPLHLGGDREE